MWWLSFVFHEMASGLLSVFTPLYIIALGGSLTHVGLMTSAAILLSIPASFLWGYLCDKGRRYKPYILLSFLFLAILLYTFTLTTNIYLLIVLYTIMAFFHMAHEPPKNVLIAEIYMRRYWEKAYALYEGITEAGWLVGIFIGFYMSVQNLTPFYILLVCSILNFVSFILSIFLIRDPAFIFERSLVKIERNILRAYKGLNAALATNGAIYTKTTMENSVKRFCIGLIAFFMATKMLFTPLPIFFSKELALQESAIYAIFCINSIGSIIGYFLMLRLPPETKTLYRMSILRCILTFSMIIIGTIKYYSVIPSALILFLLGLAYSIFHILSLSASMEVLPERMAGIFNIVTGLGEAFGSLIGPLIAGNFGFTYLFLSAGLAFFTAYLVLKRYEN
ncbi:MAG: MFS transporter [Candidatus Bathyarchaeia archaeon]